MKGALFKNKNPKGDKSPTHTGKCEIDGKEYYISAWINEKDGERYFSLKFKEKDGQPAADTKTVDEEIPF